LKERNRVEWRRRIRIRRAIGQNSWLKEVLPGRPTVLRDLNDRERKETVRHWVKSGPPFDITQHLRNDSLKDLTGESVSPEDKALSSRRLAS